MIKLLKLMREDVETVFRKDPAARSRWEVLTCYPGLHALWAHRIAHGLYRRRFFFLARLISQHVRFWTGVEIHPGAVIGRRFFIDHGAGVVIGESAEIGDDVLLYQGVVLGGTSLQKGKRHPTLGNEVIVGAGAVCLGPISIGQGAKVGAGSVVIKDVPDEKTVVGIPARVAGPHAHTPVDLNHGDLPDPVVEAIHQMVQEQTLMKRQLAVLLDQYLPDNALPGRLDEA